TTVSGRGSTFADGSARGEDFYMATSGDIDLATREDFFMATDTNCTSHLTFRSADEAVSTSRA
ncbi:MAG: hypothetical protein ACRDYB_04755, partial [Acidimicrobiales bacterium]